MRRWSFSSHVPVLLGTVIGFFNLCTADAASVGVSPTLDTFVSKTNGDNNYGKAGALAVSNGSAAKGEFQSLLRFDFSAVKSTFDSTYGMNNWAVQSVVLQLTCAGPNNGLFNNPNVSGQLGFSLMNGTNANAWTEGTGTPATTPPATDGITYNTLPNYTSGSDVSLGTFSYTAANSGNVTYALAAPAVFASKVTSGGTANLRLFAADSSETSLFDSQDFTGGTNPATARPLLTVTAVPEPAMMSLAGAFTLLLDRRRRHD
jgi:hypothetical protein